MAPNVTGADPDLQLGGKLHNGGLGADPRMGSRGTAPGHGVRKLTTFSYFRDYTFLTKLSHKLGIFRLHSELESASATG